MAETNTPRNGRRNIYIGVGLLAGLALLFGLYWLIFMRGYVTSDDARFDADMVDIAPQVGGTLDSVFVREGDAVSRGQTLFRLDTATLEAALAQAKASVTSAEAELAVARANEEKSRKGPRTEEIKMAEATEARTAAQAKLAETDWKRAQNLYQKDVTSAAERDRAEAAWETAKHAHEEAEAHLALLRQGTRSEERTVAKQNVELAQARLAAAHAAEKKARIDLEHALVKSPFDGIVVRQWFTPGATLSPGKPVLTLMDPATMHISANVEEKDLDHLSEGDPVSVSVDAYPELDLHGRVTTIVRATNSQFSLIPAEGVSGSFIKVTQRVPLRIDLDSQPDRKVSPGLSVGIKINTRGHSTDTTLAQRHG